MKLIVEIELGKGTSKVSDLDELADTIEYLATRIRLDYCNRPGAYLLPCIPPIQSIEDLPNGLVWLEGKAAVGQYYVEK